MEYYKSNDTGPFHRSIYAVHYADECEAVSSIIGKENGAKLELVAETISYGCTLLDSRR